MSDHATRRRFLSAAGALGATALAGCAGVTGGSSQTETPMEESMADGMAETMTGESMDDEMTATKTEGGMMGTTFTVTVENVSTAETLQTMDGPKPVPLAPVAYVLHEDPGVLFQAGESAIAGLERLAEDGSPTKLTEELEMNEFHTGAQAVPKGAEEAGPIGPGGTYEFTVEAHEGQHLSMATMFVQSNDLFYAPDPSGLPLWSDGEPVDGEFTDALALWDAGTEVNQEPGAGPDQAPRQDGTDTGEAENGVVRRIGTVDDGYDYPAVSDVVRLTVTPGGMDG